MRVCRYGEYCYRGCGFVVCSHQTFSSGWLLSHPMPLSIEYRFRGLVYATCHRVLGFMVSFIPYDIRIRELAHWQGIGF